MFVGRDIRFYNDDVSYFVGCDVRVCAMLTGQCLPHGEGVRRADCDHGARIDHLCGIQRHHAHPHERRGSIHQGEY